ncbi:hypothetical protein J6590_063991 [Homalodisca vitripennis]|nr:hypothetical protein J6590_063991 [Homalodisca vitripennis]
MQTAAQIWDVSLFEVPRAAHIWVAGARAETVRLIFEPAETEMNAMLQTLMFQVNAMAVQKSQQFAKVVQQVVATTLSKMAIGPVNTSNKCTSLIMVAHNDRSCHDYMINEQVHTNWPITTNSSVQMLRKKPYHY